MTNSEQFNFDKINDLSKQHIEQNDNSLIGNTIDNAYQENTYEINVFDNAYTESFTDPNPKNSYSKQKSGWELE
jgi:hypothetical protein